MLNESNIQTKTNLPSSPSCLACPSNGDDSSRRAGGSKVSMNIDCYVYQSQAHRMNYKPATYLRETKTTTTVVCEGKEITFMGTRLDTKRFTERGGSDYNKKYLSFDVADCEARIANQLLQREANSAKRDLIHAIEHTMREHSNGYGDLGATPEQVAVLIAAREMIVAAFAKKEETVAA